MPLLPAAFRRKKKRKLVSPVRPTKKVAWEGPTNIGVTQSIISDYLVCKERFRVRYIDGLAPVQKFNHYTEFGQMWHLCEEVHAKGGNIITELTDYAQSLAKRFKEDSIAVDKWFNVVKVLFPIYVDYWKDHDEEKLVSLKQEEQFYITYELPSGRKVLLRGKWDAINLIEGEGLYLQENKSKSRIDIQSIERQLKYDLQTMTYLVALREFLKDRYVTFKVKEDSRLCGVNYNVVRRPLSGGRGTIRPHKATKNKPEETPTEFYSRLSSVIEENKDDFFHRWTIRISAEDIERFERESLIPILENLCDDYEWWTLCKNQDIDPFDNEKRADQYFRRDMTRLVSTPDHYPRHYRLPYGVYNVISEGGFHSLDDYLNTGSKIGLENNTEFFPELK